MKPKLLFLSAFLPSPDAAQAGQKTAFRHLEWLAERHEIYLVSFRNEADDTTHETRLRALCRHVEVWPVTRSVRLQGMLWRPDLPLLVAARWSGAVARAVRGLVANNEFSRVHCEWSQMAAYLPLTPQAPQRWISAHDVITQFCERAAERVRGGRRLLWRWETARARRWERQAAANASHLLVQSSKDADLLRTLFPREQEKVRVVSPHFERHRPRLRESAGKGPTLLFWGALGRIENAESAKWLARELMPELRQRLPGSRLILAGSNPDAQLRAAAASDVLVPGFLPDPAAVFDAAEIAVLPLFRGAGIKVKVLECLAAGLPVLTSEIGAEGIPATEADGLFVLPPNAVAYAECIREWWQTAGRLRGMSHAAVEWGARQSQPGAVFFS